MVIAQADACANEKHNLAPRWGQENNPTESSMNFSANFTGGLTVETDNGSLSAGGSDNNNDDGGRKEKLRRIINPQIFLRVTTLQL